MTAATDSRPDPRRTPQPDFPLDPHQEVERLLNLLPASGRHKTRLTIDPQQAQVLRVPLPRPWLAQQRLSLNFQLWQQLDCAQRDLLLLRSVAWVMTVRWLKPEPYQGLVVIGCLGTGIEFLQADFVGLATGLGLTALGAVQLWRRNRSPQRDLEADAGAVRLAQRRGYSELAAIEALGSALEAVAQLEQRQPRFEELVRCQNLKAWAKNQSPLSQPYRGF